MKLPPEESGLPGQPMRMPRCPRSSSGSPAGKRERFIFHIFGHLELPPYLRGGKGLTFTCDAPLGKARAQEFTCNYMQRAYKQCSPYIDDRDTRENERINLHVCIRSPATWLQNNCPAPPSYSTHGYPYAPPLRRISARSTTLDGLRSLQTPQPARRIAISAETWPHTSSARL